MFYDKYIQTFENLSLADQQLIYQNLDSLNKILDNASIEAQQLLKQMITECLL